MRQLRELALVRAGSFRLDLDTAERWCPSPILLRPEGLYGTRPAEGGNKAAKLRAIRAALRTAKRVWLATDCDREGQLIGQEVLEHYEYGGQVMRVLFTAQDSQTIRNAFGRAKPNREYARLYAAAVARRQADQIYNLSLRLCFERVLPARRDRPVGFAMPKIETAADAAKASSAVLAACAAGDLCLVRQPRSWI